MTLTRHSLRGLAILGATAALAVAASGCATGQAPAPTPDPFASVAEGSDQAFRDGLEAYGQGQYRDALTAFERAKLLSPTGDARIDQMIDRTRAAMAPTATPVPPTPTQAPASPTAVPVAQSTETPDTELGRRYFGEVTLGVVPGTNAAPVGASTFFYQDQIGLYIEALKQHFRLPLSIRVFNTDSGALVADVKSDDASTTPAAATPTSVPLQSGDLVTVPSPRATQSGAQVARFYDSWLWYHQGGEQPGNYRLELYANGTLAKTFAYTVGTTPVATATPTAAPTSVPEPTSVPVQEDVAPPPPPTPAPAPPTRAPATTAPAAPAPAPAAPTPTPLPPTPVPPTPVPTPARSATTPLGGQLAGLDVNTRTGRVYLADASGVIWTSDSSGGVEAPSLGVPIHLDGSMPTDVAVDQTSGNIFVGSRACTCVMALDANGQPLTSIALGATPGELRIDSQLGLLLVSLPGRQSVALISVRSAQVVGEIGGLPQVSSLAVDPLRHVAYATQLTGVLNMIDPRAARVTGRWSVSTAGLSGVATARGLVEAVNTATRTLSVFDSGAQTLATYALSDEPAAVSASEATGAAYVLSSKSGLVLQMDPTDGTLLGQVMLGDRSARSGAHSAALNDLQALRPRVVLDAADESLFATLPATGALAAVSNDEFPVLAYDIPFVTEENF